jgi:3-hydroxyisobutyrate dehydrogenase
MSEVMSMGVKAGLDPLQLWEAIRGGAGGRMRTFDSISRRFLQGRLDPPSFALRLAQKDVALALQLASDVGVDMAMCEVVARDIDAAMERGWAGRDCQSFMLLQQERAGIAPYAIPEDQIDGAIART